ncbi:MAG: Gfo/Idh/MocA family oxidoreductase [Ruminococcaceae bacterium]|nr:Gfo/Idh/MocA family oxidoreductase [Oscillospiraceae bacterium]
MVGADLIDGFEVIAVAEPIDARREFIQKKFNIPDEMCRKSWEELLSIPKFADLAVIATMDRDHIAPALAAIDKGYDLLLEKPMAATPEECLRIARAAEKKGVFVQVCHVLRFTPFFRGLKSLINKGYIGDIVHIQHAECVGNLHQAHSFVRGNWSNSEKSTPMILQKSCHDMDILQWLVGRDCTRVHSFGSLSYFKKENAPKGATERCVDGCPHADTCFYNAEPYYKSGKHKVFVEAITKKPDPTPEDIDKALRTTDYGRCVFLCDNNVVDHQTVNLEFEGGATVSFSMCAFNRGSRNIRIMGTKGELYGGAKDSFVTWYDFASKEEKKISLTDMIADESIDGGHGGGDVGIMTALADRMEGNTDNVSFCTIQRTYQNHLIAFAAEESRISGRVIDMKEFESSIERSSKR